MSEYTDIKYIKGIGEARAKLLGKECGITNIRELLHYFPSRYVDRSKFYMISEFYGDMPTVQIKGKFIRFIVEGDGARNRLVGLFTDGRSSIEVVWFAGIKYIKESVKVGVEYVLFGKPSYYRFNYNMVHPEIELYDRSKPAEGFRGVYPLTETLRKRNFNQKAFHTIITNALNHNQFANWKETLPAEIVERLHLMPLRHAIASMHFPTSPGQLQSAKERLKFEELFYVQLNILRYSRRRTFKTRGHIFRVIGKYFNTFYSDVLPFDLTGAQKRVLREIRENMRTGRQMNRLLQGDVGSGKTMVAFMTMLMAVDNDYQAAMMAPTEILAAQHYETLSGWCRSLGLNCRLLTGNTGAAERKEIDAMLLDGSLHILVGTHAIIEDRVKFHNLGVAVIDEQHRFGVAQRAKMWGKGEIPPHVLVMTATPIPRTLAMTVYGDLDVSVIDELPPGRKPVHTLLRFDENRGDVDRLIFSQLKEGRQIYMVYPLIHENEKLSLKSLEASLEYVREKFAPYSVCYVHGQMRPAEKEHQMDLFVSGKASILVSTTVIEVGVNVPNATVMIIENAERFGLSQLHQLRGRVGRGADKSYCVLMTKQKIAADTRKRLNVMTATTDGFLISEADMKMRGPGDMEGTQQSGLAFNLNVANIATDGQIIERARRVAEAILDSNPSLSGFPPSKEIKNTFPLCADSLTLLYKELNYRFAKQIDWSAIS